MMVVPPRKPYDLTLADHDYASWSGPPRRSILVCTHPRSGSTLLGEALYFAGGLGCPLEYFHRGFKPGLAHRWHAGTLPEYVRAVHRFRTDPSGTLSAKLFWGDIEVLAAELDAAKFGSLIDRPCGAYDIRTCREIAALLEPIFPNPTFIHLERRDRVRQAVSDLTATQTGMFRIVPSMGSSSAKSTPHYDFARIDSLVAYSDYCHQQWRTFFEAAGAKPIALTYEALLSDYTGQVRHLLDDLGSNAAVAPIRLQRQSDGTSEAFVLRYLRDRRAAGRAEFDVT